MTTDIVGRVWQHKTGEFEGFSKKYRCNKLVWSEEFTDVTEAIAREKQIKNWRREKKVRLVESSNPDWRDLAADWYGGSFDSASG